MRRRVIQQEEGLVERVKKDLKEKRENEEEERRKRLLEEERRREILKGVYQTWQNEDILYAQQVRERERERGREEEGKGEREREGHYHKLLIPTDITSNRCLDRIRKCHQI